MDYKDQANCTIFLYCQETECSKSSSFYENTAKQQGQKNRHRTVHYNIMLHNEREKTQNSIGTPCNGKTSTGE